MELSSLACTARSAADDGINASSFVFVSPTTDNVFTFAQNNIRCYYSGGTTYKDNSLESSCLLFYLTLMGDYPGKEIVEDMDMAEIYYVMFEGDGISAYRMEFDQSGYIGIIRPWD